MVLPLASTRTALDRPIQSAKMMLRQPPTATHKASRSAAPVQRSAALVPRGRVVANVAQIPRQEASHDSVPADKGEAFQRLVEMSRQQSVNRPQKVRAARALRHHGRLWP